MDIIDHIGTVSGIDDAIYSSMDLGTAQKIILLARYLFATNGQPLPGIQRQSLLYGTEARACLFLSLGVFVKFRLSIFLNASQRSIPGGVRVGKVTDCINVHSSVRAPQRADCPFEFNIPNTSKRKKPSYSIALSRPPSISFPGNPTAKNEVVSSNL